VRGRLRKAQGFTLIELGIVLAIIAILVAIAIPTYNTMVLHSHETEAEQVWSQVETEMWSYYQQNGNYPAANGQTCAGAGSPNWPAGVDCPPTSTYWTYAIPSSSDTGSAYSFTATHGSVVGSWDATAAATGQTVTSPPSSTGSSGW